MQGRLSALATMVKDRPGTLLLALTLLALVLRLAWGLGALAEDRSLVNEGDYTSYSQAARHFLKRGNFNNSHFLVRPPAFPLLVALAGVNAALVITFNALIGALLTPLTWLLSRRLGLAPGGALLAALLVAIDPLSIRYTAFLGPGALAFAGALAMMVGLLAMLQARRQGRAILWAALAAPMLLLSVYARPSRRASCASTNLYRPSRHAASSSTPSTIPCCCGTGFCCCWRSSACGACCVSGAGSCSGACFWSSATSAPVPCWSSPPV